MIIRPYLEAIVDLRVRGGFDSPPNFKYRCIEDFFLQNGKEFASQPLTKDELAYIKSLTRGNRYVRGFCFYNAQVLVMRDLEKRLTYVEGHGCSFDIPLPIHHAWIEINGKVVDVTWKRKGKPILGRFDRIEYFGVPVEREVVRESFIGDGIRHAEVLPVVDNWRTRWPLLMVEHDKSEEGEASDDRSSPVAGKASV